MLSAAGFVRQHLSENDVKLLLIEACIQCECDRITIVYAVEDVDKFVTRIMLGGAFLWALTNNHTFMIFNQVLDDDDLRHLQDINSICGIKKMYRIGRTTTDYNVVELKFNE